MKLFTLGLIAGTAFAEPNFRPADRKLDDDAEQIDTDHTLTLIDGTAYYNLNTIAGVKVLAEAFKTQEQTKLGLCEFQAGEYTTAWGTWNQVNTDYNLCATTYSSELSTYNTCKTDADSAHDTVWGTWNQVNTDYNLCETCKADADSAHDTARATWNACETQNTNTSTIITNAEKAAGIPPRRRLDIEPRHITDALQHVHMNEIDCDEPPAVDYTLCTDPGADQCTGAGKEPAVDYTLCTDPGADQCTGAGKEPSKGNYTWGNDALSTELCDEDIPVATCNIFNPNLQCRISGIQAVIDQLIVR